MKINKNFEVVDNYDAIVVPLKKGENDIESLLCCLPEQIVKAIKIVAKEDSKLKDEQIFSLSIMIDDKIVNLVLFNIDYEQTSRTIFLKFAKAFKKCKELKAQNIAVVMKSVSYLLSQADIMQKIFELPYLVDYEFDYYKSNKNRNRFLQIDFCVNDIKEENEKIDKLIDLATICAESTVLTRNLVNQPSCYMTPQKFASEAVKVGENCGFKVEIFEKDAIESLGMKAFLSVGAGSKNTPTLVVMKYNGADDNDEKIAMIGKGIMYDSGGYSLKQKKGMVTMHDDMGGGAAVLGAMQAIAKAKLKVNLVGIVAACENKIGPDAYVPGDVIGSMAGKTIEVVSTDGEGRLTLADAITYAIREQNVNKIIDIATLTGSASLAVGNRSAAVVSNCDSLWDKLRIASIKSCEKVWRLDTDEELKHIIKSNYADIKNAPSGEKVGGTIIAGLFIEDFVEKKPWIHIDIAPVAWVSDEQPNNPKGASGYGVSLLFNMIKLMVKD